MGVIFHGWLGQKSMYDACCLPYTADNGVPRGNKLITSFRHQIFEESSPHNRMDDE